MSRVMVIDVDPGRLEADLRAAVEKIFDRFQVRLAGKKVLVKPNILAGLPPEMGVTTNPAVVGAIVDACLAQGAEVSVGDNPGGVDRNSQSTARACGIYQASRGHFKSLSERVVEVPTKSRFVPSFPISKAVLDADYLINVPCFKTHTLTTITGAVKNCFGWIAGGYKARLHLAAPSRNRFQELLMDIYQIRVPDLNIVDGLLAMEGNGPTHGQVRPLGKLLASDDAVALDATMCRMIGVDPAGLKLFQIAADRGLGRWAESDVEVEGSFAVIPDFKKPTDFSVSPTEQVSLLQDIGTTVPAVKEESCALCGDCETNCPAKAITMNPYPVVDPRKCIACFCCAELCVEGAMEVPSGRLPEKFDQMFR
ncbi:MAG TPA: DUF362 domain-containing protein [Bacillota bacterium]|jgi:uncharacterized protein (DUF362 family)